MAGTKKVKFIFPLVFLWGCIVNEYPGCPSCPEQDTEPPAPPRGFYSVTGDEKIYLYWIPNTEKDLAGYIIWRGFSYEGPFTKIAELSPYAESYIDYDVENGITYYYAISAYDTAYNESELSPENVFDTPRPDGEDIVWSYLENPDFSGFDFETQRVLRYTHPDCDFYFEWDEEYGIGYIITPDLETYVQDMGYAESFDEIGYAPAEGWSNTGVLEVIEGHIYVFWTKDNHFAKIWVKNFSDYMRFEWAYQPDPGNPELLSEGSIPLKFKQKEVSK